MSKKLLDRFIASTVAGGSRAALDAYDCDAWKYLDIVEKGIDVATAVLANCGLGRLNGSQRLGTPMQQ